MSTSSFSLLVPGQLTAAQLTHWRWSHSWPNRAVYLSQNVRFYSLLALRNPKYSGRDQLFDVWVTSFVFNQQAHILCPTNVGQVSYQYFVFWAQVSGFRGPVDSLDYCRLLYWEAVKWAHPPQAGCIDSVTLINCFVHKCCLILFFVPIWAIFCGHFLFTTTRWQMAINPNDNTLWRFFFLDHTSH